MKIGDRIRARLEAAGISQSELARRVGITQGTIAALISGKSRSSSHLHKIARVLGTTAAYLEGETDDPDKNAPPPLPPVAPAIMMSVNFPETRTLKVMFRALLAGIDRELEMDEQAQLLAERLPIAFAQLQFARTDRPTPAREAAGEDHAMPRLESTK